MANTRISDLTASASNLASTDLAPVVQTAGVGPVKMTGLQLAGGLLGSTTFNGSTVTTSSPVLNLTQTWNAGAVTFTGLKFNATDTASASGSLLLDLQTGSSSRISVAKDGVTTINGVAASFLNTLNITNIIGGTNTLTFAFGSNGSRFALGTTTNHNISLFTNNSVDSLTVTTAGAIQFRSVAPVGWCSTDDASGTRDLTLTRAAAATLQLGAADTTGTTAPTAQFLRVQSWSSSTNNDQTGANFTIQGSRGTGAGAGGSIIFQVAPAGSSGTAQNGYSTALTIDSSKNIQVAGPGAYNIASVGVNGVSHGIYYDSNTNGVGFVTGGGHTFSVIVNAIINRSDSYFGWESSGSGNFNTTYDVRLYRDAANTLALKNSTNPQIFRAYSTTTGPSYGYFASGVTDAGVATADTLFIGTGGAGAAMTKLALVVNGTTRADFNSSRTGYWGVNAAGTDILGWNQTGSTPFGTLGAGAAGVSLNAYSVNAGFGFAFLVSTSTSAGTEYMRLTSTGGLKLGSARMADADPGNGVLLCNRTSFGGTTSGFPSLKNSSASLICRLADDSANAAFEALSLKTSAPAGGTSGTWKVGVYNATAPSATGYVEVDIGGTLYKLLAST